MGGERQETFIDVVVMFSKVNIGWPAFVGRDELSETWSYIVPPFWWWSMLLPARGITVSCLVKSYPLLIKLTSTTL